MDEAVKGEGKERVSVTTMVNRIKGGNEAAEKSLSLPSTPSGRCPRSHLDRSLTLLCRAFSSGHSAGDIPTATSFRRQGNEQKFVEE